MVGPRPEDPFYVGHFVERYEEVLAVRPGITGPTALQFRDEEQILRAAGVSDADDIDALYLRELLPVKLELDAQYVRGRSVRGDVRVLRDTAQVLLLRRTREPA
jgi:lipopolysaccharide/colanic/teichoic acid biosynthesis glycosyltransferase